MSSVKDFQAHYEALKALGLKLNIERGQPGDDNFDLSNPMLTIVNGKDIKTPSGFDIRNYPGGIKGLPEARALAAEILGVRPEETIVGNNASLQLLSTVLMWALIKGINAGSKPWSHYAPPEIIVAVPGYDRHFTLLHELGFSMPVVKLTGQGPDMDEVERIAVASDNVKGILFVPTYSNPTGETLSAEAARRLVSMKTAAADFTVFADDAYAVHHLVEHPKKHKNLLRLAEDAGNYSRVFIFGSTSKITFSGAGLGFFAASVENIEYLVGLLGTQFIGPNKAEQYRHVKFLNQYKGGISGLMKDHAKLLKPKFDAVERILARELGSTGLASWTKPAGGYFVSLNTAKPVANRVVELAKGVGVAVTPAGATYPFGKDPRNSNIRIAPTRPPLPEVEKAMEVLALCIKLASAEYKEAGEERRETASPH
jgi:DNA-binding transcriptional MocR family regulator